MESTVKHEEQLITKPFRFRFEDGVENTEAVKEAIYSGDFNPLLMRALSHSTIGIIKRLNGLVVKSEEDKPSFQIILRGDKTLYIIAKMIENKEKKVIVWLDRNPHKNFDKDVIEKDIRYEFYLADVSAKINIKAYNNPEEFCNRLDKTGLELFMDILVF